MKPAARENVEIFFFSHILNGLQKELGGTLQNFAVSRLAKITCCTFALSIDERWAMNDERWTIRQAIFDILYKSENGKN